MVWRRGKFEAYGLAVREDTEYLITFFKAATDPQMWLDDASPIIQVSVSGLPSKGKGGAIEKASPLDEAFTAAMMRLLNIYWQLKLGDHMKLRRDAFRQFLSSFNGQLPFAVQLDPYAFSIANLSIDFIPNDYPYKVLCPLVFINSDSAEVMFRVLSADGLLPVDVTPKVRFKIASAELPQIVITNENQVKVINLFD